MQTFYLNVFLTSYAYLICVASVHRRTNFPFWQPPLNLTKHVSLDYLLASFFIWTWISHAHTRIWIYKSTIVSSRDLFGGELWNIPWVSCHHVAVIIFYWKTLNTQVDQSLCTLSDSSRWTCGDFHMFMWLAGCGALPSCFLLFGGHQWLITCPGEPLGCYTEPLQR